MFVLFCFVLFCFCVYVYVCLFVCVYIHSFMYLIFILSQVGILHKINIDYFSIIAITNYYRLFEKVKATVLARV